MRSSTINLLMDNLANLSNRIHAVEVAFVDFTEENPKSPGQWQEERLRALEHQVKAKEDRREWNGEDDDCEINIKDVSAHGYKIEARVNTIESELRNREERFSALWHDHGVLVQRFEALSAKSQVEDPWQKIASMHQEIRDFEVKLDEIKQGKDAQITRLENVVAELGLALGNLSQELKDLKTHTVPELN